MDLPVVMSQVPAVEKTDLVPSCVPNTHVFVPQQIVLHANAAFSSSVVGCLSPEKTVPNDTEA